MVSWFVDKILDQFALREDQVKTSFYGSVSPDPTISQAIEIARQMADFKPDTVVLLGGGQPLMLVRLPVSYMNIQQLT